MIIWTPAHQQRPRGLPPKCRTCGELDPLRFPKTEKSMCIKCRNADTVAKRRARAPSVLDRVLDRLRNHVRIGQNGCRIWAGAVHPQTSRPRMTYQGRQRPAQRLLIELTRGPIPANHVVHVACGNPRCMAPEHLFTDLRASFPQ